MIEYDETDGQGGFTTQSLLAIESLIGREIAELLYGTVFPLEFNVTDRH